MLKDGGESGPVGDIHEGLEVEAEVNDDDDDEVVRSDVCESGTGGFSKAVLLKFSEISLLDFPAIFICNFRSFIFFSSSDSFGLSLSRSRGMAFTSASRGIDFGFCDD